MSDQPPTNQPPGETGPPAGPFNIPFARPVTLQADAILPSAGVSGPRTIGRLRALIEMLILIPATLLGIAFTVGPLSFLRLADTRWYNLASSVGMGCGALLACMAMLIIDRHKPASIGWTAGRWKSNVALGCLGLVGLYGFVFLPASLAFPYVAEQSEVIQRQIQQTFPPLTLGWNIVLMAFVAVWEETIFRGFVLTRLQTILKRWWLAVIVSAVLFASIHGYQSILAVGAITCLALVMGSLFAWRRSLVPCIALHWMHNMVTLLVIHAAQTATSPAA
jgi:membrane protease YdiL (CAAX protease family)